MVNAGGIQREGSIADPLLHDTLQRRVIEAAALRAGLEGVVARGKAEPGDKTMYDALAPALDALDAALSDGAGWDVALRRASEAAGSGRDATIEMLARKGRASYLGERSIGHQDPGATSAALLVASAYAALCDCA